MSTASPIKPSSTKTDTVFNQAAKIFQGSKDPITGARLLHITPPGKSFKPGQLHTLYHQFNGFLDNGSKLLLRTGTSAYAGGGGVPTYILDLTTGDLQNPFPQNADVYEVSDKTKFATFIRTNPSGNESVLWDMRSQTDLAVLPVPVGWRLSGLQMLSDGSGAFVSHVIGKNYTQFVQSKIHLLRPGQPTKEILHADGYFCNHMQSCPIDPNLFAYDRWPSPLRNVDQVIHIASIDGAIHEPAKLDAHAVRPGSMYGARDHYVWTPDAKYIVSYLNPENLTTQQAYSPEFNHFKIPWILSVLNWRTGQDISVPYPPARWGCHAQITNDSRYMISAGGNGFDNLYLVDLAKLKDGWNERILCQYPTTISMGNNVEPFPQPAMLPDSSGILFNCGWPSEKHGVYMVEYNG
jgi:hypothetical protein